MQPGFLLWGESKPNRINDDDASPLSSMIRHNSFVLYDVPAILLVSMT